MDAMSPLLWVAIGAAIIAGFIGRELRNRANLDAILAELDLGATPDPSEAMCGHEWPTANTTAEAHSCCLIGPHPAHRCDCGRWETDPEWMPEPGTPEFAAGALRIADAIRNGRLPDGECWECGVSVAEHHLDTCTYGGGGGPWPHADTVPPPWTPARDINL